MNYSARPEKFPKVASWSWIPLVHRTLSGGTPDSPVRQTRVLLGILKLFLFEPFLLIFLLAYCEPLVPVELINLGKLVSPIICVEQFNHQNQFRK